jgi:hypothetical protein
MTPKKAYLDQKYHAEARQIPWLFTYEDWLELWLLSGKWFLRGRGQDKYCVCRYGDEGAYSSRNCYIGTGKENAKDTRRTTDEEALEIINLYKNTKLSQREIGEKFQLHQTTICRIIQGTRRAND